MASWASTFLFFWFELVDSLEGFGVVGVGIVLGHLRRVAENTRNNSWGNIGVESEGCCSGVPAGVWGSTLCSCHLKGLVVWCDFLFVSILWRNDYLPWNDYADVSLTFRRSEYFAVAYAANDIVLICLWILALQEDLSYLSVVACFAAFLINDIYGYISWRHMAKRQALGL